METGTLKELNVKPGDVVECVDHGVTEDHLTVGKYYGIVKGPMIHTDMGSWWGDGDLAHTAFPMLAEFRIVSRAEQATPTPDLTAISTPFGLLDESTQEALRAHGGPYEYWNHLCKWTHTDGPAYDFKTVYRVKSEPIVEMVTLDRSIDSLGCISMSSGHTTVRVTFNRINGVIDLASYKVEPR